jgi:hypothetical protein
MDEKKLTSHQKPLFCCIFYTLLPLPLLMGCHPFHWDAILFKGMPSFGSQEPLTEHFFSSLTLVKSTHCRDVQKIQ